MFSKISLFSFLILTLISCLSEKPKNEILVGEFKFDENLISSNKSNLSDSLQVKEICTRFYEEVVLGHDTPDVIENEQGTYFLDMESHVEDFKSLNLFTENFLQNEYARFSKCNDYLDSVKLVDDEIIDEGIEYMGITQCDFQDYAFYLNAQEQPDYFELENTKSSNDTMNTEIHYFQNDGIKIIKWDSQVFLKCKLIKSKKSGWKIDEVIKK